MLRSQTNKRLGARKTVLLVAISSVLSLPSPIVVAQAPAGGSAAHLRGVAPDVHDRAIDLLKSMSAEEKMGQLSQLFFFGPSASMDDRIRKGELGSVLFTTDSAQINRMQHLAVEGSPHHIPLLFGFDVIHGLRTIFPVPIAMAASWDPAVSESAQSIAAKEARAVGVHWAFAPMVDIARDHCWGRMVEGAGEDPYLGAAIARAQVRGFQGDHLGKDGHVIACVKHFAGYGGAEGGRDYDGSNLSDAELWNVYLPPFRAAVDAGAGTVMSAYMDLNDVPATGNRWLLHDVLRKDWGFKGFVVSDADAVKSLKTHGFASNANDAAVRAFDAGVNMEMAIGSTAFSKGLPEALKAGSITPEALDDAVRPILEEKIAMGLFEHPYVDEAKVGAATHDPASRTAARVAAERSAVLLKNEGSLLPLNQAKYKRIAVIGPFATSQVDIQGPWSLAADSTEAISIEEGLKRRLPQGAIIDAEPGVQLERKFPSPFDALTKGPKFVKWSDTQANDEFDQAVNAAKNSDLVILALGELQSMSGESASVSTLELAGRQQQLMEAVMAIGKPVVLVLINGRPLDIRWAVDHVPSILEAWFPGSEGGPAIANLLFGGATPGGKLPFTWPRDAGQEPMFYAHNTMHAPFNQGKRYWNEESTPLFPFGFGLSYAKFGFSNLKLDKASMKAGDSLTVSVYVENQAEVAGDEVVQLYIHQQSGTSSRPVRELKGFNRVALKPHEKQRLSFLLARMNSLTGPPPGMIGFWMRRISTCGLVKIQQLRCTACSR